MQVNALKYMQKNEQNNCANHCAKLLYNTEVQNLCANNLVSLGTKLGTNNVYFAHIVYTGKISQ